MDESTRITELLERLARMLANDSHATDLKPVQWEVLHYLEQANRFSRTPGGVTTFLNLTKGTVSQTLMALEQKGLVTKRSSKQDRRSVQLDLTSAAKKLLSRLNPHSTMNSAVRSLSKASRSGLLVGLQELLHSRISENEGRGFGLCVNCRHFRRNDPAGKPHRCALLEEPLREFESGQICVEQEVAA